MINGPGGSDHISSGAHTSECKCACHNPPEGTQIMHCIACCRQCLHCHKNIVIHCFDDHVGNCDFNLDTEVEYFDQHRIEWLEHHGGKIALVKGNSIHGFYDTYDNALIAGYEKFGIVSFLLKEVRLKDEILFFPSPLSHKLVKGEVNE